MFGWIKKIKEKVSELNNSISRYQKDSVIQSLPTVAYVNTAKNFIEEKDFNSAEELLLKALDISTQDSMVYKYLGIINEKRLNFSKAVEYYKQSSKLNPNDKDIWLKLAMSQLYSKQIEKSLLSFEQANKKMPFNTDVYTGWGMAYMQLKKTAQALEKFNMATKINKYNYSAILLSAVMEIRLEKYNQAEEKLKFLVKVAPKETSYYEYAHLKLIKENYSEAEIYAKKSIELNEKMLPAYLILGEIYSLDFDKIKTEEIFNTAKERDLISYILYVEWGRAYLRLFEFVKAKECFQLALENKPDNIEAKQGMALVQAMNSDFSMLDEIKEKNLKDSYIQQAIGIEFISLNKLNDAVDMFKKSLKTDDKQIYNYLLLARTYKLLNKNDKTRDNYETFIQAKPKYLEGIIEYANWLIEIKDYNEANRKLLKAEKIEPNNTKVLNSLFYVSNILARENICEYNIKETLKIATRIENLGIFEYKQEKEELENILNDLKGKN